MQVNLSSTSFGSTYKVDYNLGKGPNSLRDAYGIECFCNSHAIDYAQQFNNVRPEIKRDTDAVATGTIVANDWQDKTVECFLASRGVQYRKIDYASLVGQESIIARSVLPEYTPDSTMALLDVDRFDALLKKHPHGNVEYCEDVYHKHHARTTDSMIKSCNKIVVPALHINSPYLGVEQAALQYGEDAIANDTLSFYFNQTDSKPNQCLYFAMKNCGMSKVPVSVDERSYQFGKALGLFE